MTSALVDSNVLIDIFEPASPWFDWSRDSIRAARAEGSLVLNGIIASEVAMLFSTMEKFEAALSSPFWRYEDIPRLACFEAGAAHRAYRAGGGARDRVLPDFLIGAHAAVQGYRLVTRDARRYRTYFPALAIIAPDTHP